MLPRLTSLLRTGVGGNTRAGTCDFLSQVASSKPAALATVRAALRTVRAAEGVSACG